jgi:hypothetical protein
LRERALQQPALLRDRKRLGAHLAALFFEQRERAVCLRDGALGGAQAITRLFARFLFALELPRERVDAAAQRFEILFFRCREGRGRPQGERKKKDSCQVFAFPCAETAAMRFATSFASPR